MVECALGLFLSCRWSPSLVTIVGVATVTIGSCLICVPSVSSVSAAGFLSSVSVVGFSGAVVDVG